MIEYLDQLKTIALTALFNPAFLALLALLFFVGRIFGKLTKNLRLWKILLLGYFAIFLIEPVRDAGPILGGVFIAGMLSNHIGTFFSVLAWASSLRDVLFALKYKSAYADIRRREEELEERERQLREAEMRQAYKQQDQGSRARSGWQQDAKNFRQKPEEKKARRSSGSKQNKRPNSQSQKQRTKASYTPPPQNDLRAKHLQTLGLKSGREYSPDQIRKAYRRRVMKVHPDAGGSQVEFIAVQNAYEWLRSQV